MMESYFSQNQNALLQIVNSRDFTALEQLALRLNIRQSVVVKTLQQLQDLGVPIERQDNSVKLDSRSALLCSAKISDSLQQQGISINRVQVLPSVASTNSYLLEKAQYTEVVLTENQFRGVGRRSSSWQSAAFSNLSLSLGYFSPTNAKNLPVLSLITANALANVLDHYCSNIHIKWPNDIFVGSQKISGILVQSKHIDSQHIYVVVGIGLNIDQPRVQSADYRHTNLLEHWPLQDDKLFDRNALAVKIIASFWKHITAQTPLKTVVDVWHQRALYLHQKVVLIDKDYQKIVAEGVFKGIDNKGSLLLQVHNSDKIQKFHSASISLRLHSALDSASSVS